MAKVTVYAGVCGFTAVIKAEKVDRKNVLVKIACPCEMIQDLGRDLEGREIGRDAFVRLFDSMVYKLANEHVKHTACPVPAAVLKAIEVELGLALPEDVKMKIKK